MNDLVPDSRFSRTAIQDAAVLGAGAAAFVGLYAYAALWSAKTPSVAVLVAIFAVAAAAILRKARTPAASIAVVLAGLGLYAVYFSYTRPTDRSTDPSSHVAYITWLLDHHSLPSGDQCVVCHHPPAYYILAAIVRQGAETLRFADVDAALQTLSFALFSTFVLFSTLTVDRLVPKTYQRVIATAIVVFWPYAVINSVRISNDSLLYTLASVFFYCLARWSTEGLRKFLIGASVAATAALFVKANGLALVITLFALVALRVYQATDRKAVLRACAAPLAATLAIAFVFQLARGPSAASLPRKVLGTAYEPVASHTTPRTFRYYLTFSPTAIVHPPYVLTNQYRSQEPSFWNHLIKSSLFGTRNPTIFVLSGFKDPNPAIATASNGALLALLATLLFGMAATWCDKRTERTVSFLYVGVFVASSLAFHLAAPLGYHADFRLVFPVVVPMSVLFAQAVDGVRRRGILLWHLGYLVPNVFLALAIAYFMPFTFPAPGKGTISPAPAGPLLRIPLRPNTPFHR